MEFYKWNATAWLRRTRAIDEQLDTRRVRNCGGVFPRVDRLGGRRLFGTSSSPPYVTSSHGFFTIREYSPTARLLLEDLRRKMPA